MQGEQEAIVDRISGLIEEGNKPEDIEGILRATGWPEINGKSISSSAYAGLLTVSVFEIQNRMRKSHKLNHAECRAQLWDMAKSFASVCLITGELKYVADALKVMGAALEIEPPQRKKPKVIEQPKLPNLESLSTEELQRMANKSAEGSA